MPTTTTVGRLLLEAALPESMRGAVPAELNKDGLKSLFGKLAEHGPDAYRKAALALHKIGGAGAFESGGYSPGLDDLIAPPGVESARAALAADVDRALTVPDAKARAAALSAAVDAHRPKIGAALAAHAQDNAFARQIRSNAKGNPSNLQALLAGDLAYADQNYKPIPFPILRSFGEGVDPHEYFAGTFGARQGLTLLKLGTAKGGYFCLDGDTPVRLADYTTRPVRAVAVGDWVLGADRDGRARPVQVTGRSENGPRACLTATFVSAGAAGGRPVRFTLTATAEHRVLLDTAAGRVLVALGEAGPGDAVVLATTAEAGGPAVAGTEVLGGAWGLAAVEGLETALPVSLSSWDDHSAAWFLAGALSACARRHRSRPRAGRAGRPFYEITVRTPSAAEALASALATRLGIGPATVHPASATHAGHVVRVVAREAVESLDRLVAGRFVGPLRVPGRYVLESLAPAGPRETYDLEVDHPDHLFVLASGLVVANSKRLLNAAHRLMVTAPDGPEPAGIRGLPVKLSDPDNEGALLAHPAGGFPRNTVLTPEVISALHDKGVQDLLVRSPLVGGPPDGGVYGRDVGVRERGAVSPVGEYVGISAANAVAEPAVQSLISSKHTGGVAGSTGAQEGFPVLDRLISIPENFPGAATHARLDGSVGAVTPAPQGGQFVKIGDQTHYVSPERRLRVREGDEVEAGDALTDGTHNPEALVEHKGIGEGRRRFVEAFMGAARQAGFKPHRRNIEVLARGLIDHVRLDAEHGHFSPGDVVSYTALEHEYTPREGGGLSRPSQALGRYLEAPVLHHTIGTRVTKSVAAELERHGVESVHSHPNPPPFSPVMIRSHDVVNHDPDVLTRTLGTRVHGGFLDAVHRGADTDLRSTSFVPVVAAGLPFKPGTTPGPGLKPPEPGGTIK
jgi:hypothetical protein